MFQILVIDDDRNTRHLFKAISENEHYVVYTAEKFTVTKKDIAIELPQKEFLLQ